jgi:hypothetical protein
MMEAFGDFGWVMLGFMAGVLFMLLVLRGSPRMYEKEGYRPKKKPCSCGKPPKGGSGVLRPPQGSGLRSPRDVGSPRPRPPRPRPPNNDDRLSPREVLE